MITEKYKFPIPEKLLEQINVFSNHDPYSESILSLERALRPYERQGTISGFRTWLLASELSRQLILWDSILDLTAKPQNIIRIQNALTWLSDWPHPKTQEMSWNKMLRVITDKTVALAYGSFRKIPTPAQIAFVRKGVIDGERTEKNILVYEPQKNITCYKPDRETTFPDNLRSTMWKNIPLIDIVVRNRRFSHNNPFTSWQENHEQIKKRAKIYKPIREFLGKLSWQREKAENTQLSKIGLVWENDPHNPAYLGYSTSLWESACTGEPKFIDVATRFLVTRQG